MRVCVGAREEHEGCVCLLGNAVVVKPSEISEHTSQLIADILPQYLDPVSTLGAWCLDTSRKYLPWFHVAAVG